MPPWYLLPIPQVDNTPPMDLPGGAPDMVESAQAGVVAGLLPVGWEVADG